MAVSAYSNGGSGVLIGGLIGSVGGGSVVGNFVSNCYALGNVLADVNGLDIEYSSFLYAGGLVGWSHDYGFGMSINNCFAAGSVTAQSRGSVVLCAGGILGQLTAPNTALENNAALGASITLKGSGGTMEQGRIYGRIQTYDGYYDSSTVTVSGNYALDTMRLEKGAYGDYYFPSPSFPTGTGAHNNKDGANAAASAFRDSNFWKNLGFSSTYWNFGVAASRGYPILNNVGGQ
jgi:hypothetical protein